MHREPDFCKNVTVDLPPLTIQAGRIPAWIIFRKERKMKALNHSWISITIVLSATLLAVVGCQGAANLQPTAAPAETVVAEREANCPQTYFNLDVEGAKGVQVIDPELGEMTRGVLSSFTIDCPEPYLKGKWVGISDSYSPSKDTVYWKEILEGITDEGGVWIGEIDAKPPIISGTFTGDGKYKGLQLKTEFTIDTNNVKISVTKVTGQ